jgi:trehalose 6-phosphate synthase
LGLLIAGVVGLLTSVVEWQQLRHERRIDQEDQDRRAHALAFQILPAARAVLAKSDVEAVKEVGTQLEGHRRLIGFAIFRPGGRMVASGKAVPEFADAIEPVVAQVLAGRAEAMRTVESQGTWVHVLAARLAGDGGETAGALAVVHDVSHLEDRAASRLARSAFWIVAVSLLLTVVVVGATWSAYERPLQNLATWMQRLRTDSEADVPPGLPVARLASESARLAASYRAIRTHAADGSRAAVAEHNVWTRDRLRDHAVDCLRGGQLVVASNREPYMHQSQGGKPRVIVPAGGLVTALDPILQACGGLWVAHGAGDADREAADAKGRLMVPPADPRYTLRRVWLSRDEEQGYYYGFSNEGLWPLCHLAHERPTFRTADWACYAEVNRRFAETILDEVGDGEAMVLVQDYHLALVPRFLKAKRPDIRVGIFWHIPWPNPEAFRICPWRAEILQGMLGADLVGFHLQQYCNNFLDTVDRMVEARLDWDHFAAEVRGHRSIVRPFPISVENWSERNLPAADSPAATAGALRAAHGLGAARVVLGVDRIDYTKGLPERLRAIDRLFEKYPEQRGKVTFVQLGAPSRTHIRRYRELVAEIESRADEVNWRYRTDGWSPVRLLIAHHDAAAVHAFMTLAEVCVVSSLHDGMNLVAKEYVMAKPDGDGALVLSEFAGAAREMEDAVVINPYDVEQFADALHAALTMPVDERRARMLALRRVVEEYNIYRWAAMFLTDLAATRTAAKPAGSVP